MRLSRAATLLLAALLANCAAAAYVPSGTSRRRPALPLHARAAVAVASEAPVLDGGADAAAPPVLSDDAAASAAVPEAPAPELPPLPLPDFGPHVEIKGKVLNWFGLLFGLQSAVFLGVIWYIGISACEQVCSRTGWDEDRKFHDRLGKWWSWANLALGGCSPAIFGQDNLPAEGTGALFVSNHASWFDIPLVAQAIPNTYKFVAADELRAVPIVSQQLIDGKHILIDRSTRKGQLKSFKESVNYLKKGVGVFAFPEGTRSRSGRMMPFKGGVFAMATKAGVPIVPITVCGTYYTYPSQAILPLRPNPVDDNWLHAALLEQGIVPEGAAEEALEVHIHPQISSDGRTEAELEELTRAAILSKLPKVNHPLEA